MLVQNLTLIEFDLLFAATRPNSPHDRCAGSKLKCIALCVILLCLYSAEGDVSDQNQVTSVAILARGQPLFDAAFAKVDTAETGSLSKAQVKAVVEKMLSFKDTPDDEIEQQVKEDLDWVMGAADLDTDGNISKQEGWQFMTEEVLEGIEEVDEWVLSIEEFIETKLCAADEQSAKEAEWQAKRQAKEAERQAKRQPILARGQPLFDAAFAKVDTAETGSLSKAQVKAYISQCNLVASAWSRE